MNKWAVSILRLIKRNESNWERRRWFKVHKFRQCRNPVQTLMCIHCTCLWEHYLVRWLHYQNQNRKINSSSNIQIFLIRSFVFVRREDVCFFVISLHVGFAHKLLFDLCRLPFMLRVPFVWQVTIATFFCELQMVFVVYSFCALRNAFVLSATSENFTVNIGWSVSVSCVCDSSQTTEHQTKYYNATFRSPLIYIIRFHFVCFMKTREHWVEYTVAKIRFLICCWGGGETSSSIVCCASLTS